jgi:hypothetical protein
MSRSRFASELRWLFASLAGVLVVGVTICGCSKKEAEKPLAPSEVQAEIEKAFKKAEPETQKAAQEIATSVAQYEPKALEELQALTAKPDLTAEQRRAADRAYYSYLAAMQQAATNGNAKAKEAIDKYRATK